MPNEKSPIQVKSTPKGLWTMKSIAVCGVLACLFCGVAAAQTREYDPDTGTWKEVPQGIRTAGDNTAIIWLFAPGGGAKAIAALEFKGEVLFMSTGFVSGEQSLRSLRMFDPPDYNPDAPGKLEKITKAELVQGRIVMITDSGKVFTIHDPTGFSAVIEPERLVPEPSKSGTNKEHRTASEIHDAAKNGDLAKVQALLKDNPALVSSRDDDGWTPLHHAAYQGSKDVAELLLANKADVNAKDNGHNTPLHAAARTGHKDVAELLLANKAEVNAKDIGGNTPLHAAARTGHKDVAELLLANKADVNAKDNGHNTPLHYAAANNHTDLAELLRQHGGQE